MPKPRPAGSRIGKTISFQLDPALKAAVEAEAARRGLAVAELIRQTLAAALQGRPPLAAPTTTTGLSELEGLATRLEAIAGRLERLNRRTPL